MAEIRDRHLRSAILDALEDTRVVVVSGARQAGKSTLVKLAVGDRANTEFRRLDRPNDLAAAKFDPETFVRSQSLLVIDEVQRAPELVLPIKARVDDDRRPGQFLLTGSARLLGLRSLPDSLIGRSETIELWPFSQGELEGHVEQFVDRVFDDGDMRPFESDVTKPEYLDLALSGGYPEAVRRVPSRRDKFFGSYINDLIDRDITAFGDPASAGSPPAAGVACKSYGHNDKCAEYRRNGRFLEVDHRPLHSAARGGVCDQASQWLGDVGDLEGGAEGEVFLCG